MQKKERAIQVNRQKTNKPQTAYTSQKANTHNEKKHTAKKEER